MVYLYSIKNFQPIFPEYLAGSQSPFFSLMQRHVIGPLLQQDSSCNSFSRVR